MSVARFKATLCFAHFTARWKLPRFRFANCLGSLEVKLKRCRFHDASLDAIKRLAKESWIDESVLDNWRFIEAGRIFDVHLKLLFESETKRKICVGTKFRWNNLEHKKTSWQWFDQRQRKEGKQKQLCGRWTQSSRVEASQGEEETKRNRKTSFLFRRFCLQTQLNSRVKLFGYFCRFVCVQTSSLHYF